MATGKNDGAGNSEPGNDGANVVNGNDDPGNDGATIGGIPVTSTVGIDGSSADTGGQPAKRGRGRPAGTGKSAAPKTEGKKVPPSVSGVEKILFAIHLGVAEFTGVKEIALDDKESKLLAGAITDVAQHYDIAPDPKVMAWVGLFGALGAVYGPRVAAYNFRKSMEPKTEPENKMTGSVVDFPSFAPMGAMQ